MTKLEKAKEYVAQKVARDGGSDAWREGDLIDAWLDGYDTAQKEFFDDILDHNKDILERLKNNVPPAEQDKMKIALTHPDAYKVGFDDGYAEAAEELEYIKQDAEQAFEPTDELWLCKVELRFIRYMVLKYDGKDWWQYIAPNILPGIEGWIGVDFKFEPIFLVGGHIK